MDVPNDRRTHPRYRVKNNVFLYNGTTFAEIVNISEGGAFCRFLMDTDNHPSPISLIELINTPEKVYIHSVPCKDLNCHGAETRLLSASTAIRDCRLQFIPLNNEQQEQLINFINSATTAPA